MDMKMFIPIYGPYLEYKRLHESDEPFEIKAYNAALIGAIVGTEMILQLAMQLILVRLAKVLLSVTSQ